MAIEQYIVATELSWGTDGLWIDYCTWGLDSAFYWLLEGNRFMDSAPSTLQVIGG